MENLNLKPDRKLLDAKFESYRLSLEPLPVLKQSIVGGVEQVELGDEQYGYLHAQIFGLVNHLVADPFANESVFYVNPTKNIQCIQLTQEGRLSPQRCVWQIPQSDFSGKIQNSSISFAHAEWAAVCNGSSEIFLLNTPSRSEGEPWLQCHVHHIEEPDMGLPSILLHSMYKNFPSHHQLECLLCYVSKSEKYSSFINQSNSNAHFVCVLEWLTFSCAVGKECSDAWFTKRHRRFIGFSAPLYAYFETLTGMLVTVSEKSFQLIYDSEKQVINNEEIVDKVNEEQPPLYFFVQTNEDICVTFKVEIESRSDISIQIQSSNLRVRVKDKAIIDGPLFLTVDAASSTWTFVNNRLEIFLTKATEGWWKQFLLNGDERGLEVMDSALVEEVQERLAHLTSENEVVDVNRTPAAYDPQELEDCDLTSYENLILQRFDGENHSVTHQANMGGYQWLFKVTSSGESLPPFCTRYDVDGVVWQASTTSKENEAEKFIVEHVATHQALGYVLASKQDRKFISAAPDYGYAAVCDTNRHIYIYHQPQNLPKDTLSLRNRKTGREVDRIAKQHVISLDQCDSILGLHASNLCVFVLAKNFLYAIKIDEPNLEFIK